MKDPKLLEPIDLSVVEEVRIPVKVAGKSYVLKAPTGAAVLKQRNAMLSKATVNTESGKVETSLSSTDHILVGNCLFAMNGDGKEEDKPVGEEQILSWPGIVGKTLYERMRELGWTKWAGDSDAKKPPSSLTDGSELGTP